MLLVCQLLSWSACPPGIMATERPSTNKENCPPSKHFDFDLDDNDDFETMSKLFQPKNTQQSTLWGLNIFTALVKEKNKHKPRDKCPP